MRLTGIKLAKYAFICCLLYSKITMMNFGDALKLRFRKKGLSEIEINNKIRTYYYFSVAILLAYSLAAVIELLGRYGVSVFSTSLSDLESDITNA